MDQDQEGGIFDDVVREVDHPYSFNLGRLARELELSDAVRSVKSGTSHSNLGDRYVGTLVLTFINGWMYQIYVGYDPMEDQRWCCVHPTKGVGERPAEHEVLYAWSHQHHLSRGDGDLEPPKDHSQAAVRIALAIKECMALRRRVQEGGDPHHRLQVWELSRTPSAMEVA